MLYLVTTRRILITRLKLTTSAVASTTFISHNEENLDNEIETVICTQVW